MHELDPEAQSESDIVCMEYRRVRVGVEECGSADKNLGTRKRDPNNPRNRKQKPADDKSETNPDSQTDAEKALGGQLHKSRRRG